MTNGSKPDPKNNKTARIGDVLHYFRGGDLRNTPMPCVVTAATPEGVLTLAGLPNDSNQLEYRSGVRYHEDPYFTPPWEKAVPKRQRIRSDRGVWNYPTPASFQANVEAGILALKTTLQLALTNAVTLKATIISTQADLDAAKKAEVEDTSHGAPAQSCSGTIESNLTAQKAQLEGTLTNVATIETSIDSLKAELKAAKQAEVADAKAIESGIAKLKAEVADAKLMKSTAKPKSNEPAGDHDRRRTRSQPAPVSG